MVAKRQKYSECQNQKAWAGTGEGAGEGYPL